MLQMLAHSWRSWKNAKAVAILAIIALATGIGCATAIFTVVNAVMLKPLPYSQPDRWVALFAATTLRDEANEISSLSYGDLEDYQQRTTSFDAFGWYSFVGGDLNLSAPGLTEHIEGVAITPSLLNSIGISPVLGRLFNDSDGPHVAVISRKLWNQLGSNPAIIGRSIKLNGDLYVVTGVVPPWFQVPIVRGSSADLQKDVWIPAVRPGTQAQLRTSFAYGGYARLKPGVTVAQARADAKRVAAQIVKENNGDQVHSSTYTVAVFGLQDFVARDARPYLFLFLAAAGLLLLITCANVAGLLVTRSVSRAHEIAVRLAIGARRRDLASQFLFEGLLLAIAAGALGLLASVGLTRAVLSLASTYIPRAAEVSPDFRVILFVAVLVPLTAILPALPPLRQALRTPPNEVLNASVRASASARSRRISRSLVVAEITLAFVLLSVCGLVISELQTLRLTSPGFDASHLLTFEINADDENFPSAKEFAAHQEQILRSLEALPSVSGAAVSNELPLAGCCMITFFRPQGQPLTSDVALDVNFLKVSPGYFNTMRIPLEKGRLLNAGDTSENPIAIVIDESAAKRYWPDRDPVGAIAFIGDLGEAKTQVVGVVGDVRNEGLGQATRPEIYFLDSLERISPIHFIVRSTLPPATLVPAVRSVMQKAEPERAIYSIRSEDEVLTDSLTPQRLSSVVMAFFALAAFLMASLGIYGVTSYSVRERTVELGTRMALGAMPRDLRRMVIGDGLRMAVYGLLIGIPAAAGATWLVMHYLQVHHLGPLPYAAAILLVGGVAIAASLFPAWRATLLSPMVAIRNESESLWTVDRRSLAQTLHAGHSKEQASVLDPAVLTGFIDASRRADSFSQALAIALEDLRGNLHAQSAMLFENTGGSDSQYCLRTASPQVPVAHSIPPDGFLIGRLRFNTFPLEFAADEMETVLRWASEQKPQHIPEIEFLKKFGVRLAVPLRTKDNIIGVLLLGVPVGRDSYTLADRELVQLCTQQLALMIENARLTARVVEQDKVRRDVALAAEVQERLLPEKSIEDGMASIAAFTLPARGVGGDCHDFLELADNEIGIALADVSGKGIAAALIMAAIQASVRILTAEKQISPAELASKMNSFLYRATGFDRYATFFYVQLNSEKRSLRYVNAGHNPPYLVRVSPVPEDGQSANIEELKTGGTVIGMFPSADYEEAQVEMRPGDVMLAFTDGVTEALNSSQEEFSEVRLKNLLTQVSHLPVKEMIPRIAAELRAWIGDAPQHDDMTFIIAKINR